MHVWLSFCNRAACLLHNGKRADRTKRGKMGKNVENLPRSKIRKKMAEKYRKNGKSGLAGLHDCNSLSAFVALSYPCVHKAGTKNQSPKRKLLGRTSGGHSRGHPGPKLRLGRSKSWKNKHLGADVQDPKVRTSTTLRDFQKLRSEKLWAEFSFPNKNKSGTHPQKTKMPPLEMRNSMGVEGFLQKAPKKPRRP